MKPLNRIFALFFLLFVVTSCAVQQQQTASYTQTPDGQVDFQVFYDDLSPYGQWVDNPNYGYVWIPDVNQDFAPYSTDGYWVNTEYGWTWVSNYNWGWAPFHYGRWDYDNYYGWYWVPDNEWGPSWVTWRTGNGYYGWAPMRPGINIDRSFNNDYGDMNRWNFVRERDFGRSDINRYYVDRREYNTIIHNSTVINNTTVDRRRNTTYVAGPPRENVQRATGRRINSVTIQDSNRPGQRLNNKQLSIYRPQVERTADKAQRPAPSRVTNVQEVKSPRERNAANPQNNVTPRDNTRQRQQTQPVAPQTQQPSVTPQQQQQNIRRRSERQPQQIQKPEQSVQPPQQQPAQPQQNDRRRQDQPQGQGQPQRDNVQPVTPSVQQPQVNPQQQQQQNERNRQEQQQRQQQPQKQETQTPPVQQQPQVAPQQPNVEQPAPQPQQRRQERQQVKQQQRNVTPAGNSRRERQPKAKEETQKEQY